ncbi:MAG: hypothetical protein LUG18_01540 [Candidatus Azobacteroides sp.]|nr:hypothetical protein [Candidatus Azobacteroides sp.]
MTEEHEKILKNFELKVRLLMNRYEKLKAENQDLKDMLARKEGEIKEAKELVQEATSKYDNLKLAKIISTDDEEVKKMKKRLSGIVREIDKCIALLNQ